MDENTASLYVSFKAQADHFGLENADAQRGNKAAGVRARKAAREMEKILKKYRTASLVETVKK